MVAFSLVSPRLFTDFFRFEAFRIAGSSSSDRGGHLCVEEGKQVSVVPVVPEPGAGQKEVVWLWVENTWGFPPSPKKIQVFGKWKGQMKTPQKRSCVRRPSVGLFFLDPWPFGVVRRFFWVHKLTEKHLFGAGWWYVFFFGGGGMLKNMLDWYKLDFSTFQGLSVWNPLLGGRRPEMEQLPAGRLGSNKSTYAVVLLFVYTGIYRKWRISSFLATVKSLFEDPCKVPKVGELFLQRIEDRLPSDCDSTPI